MSVSGPPGFVSTLPLVVLLGLVGSSVVVAYCVRTVAARYGTDPGFSHGGIVLVCLCAQLLVLVFAALALVGVGGLPSGPLFGPPLQTLARVYGLPLLVVSLLLGETLGWLSSGGVPRRLKFLWSALFVVVHLLTIPAAWAAFVLLR
ncbi:hypothetical protein [Halospeciosus flavus]|uniref:Yip1 domain-containing protein n=1 Tax=Halospeciosus flavus TaxID=3032283 RepID=A0ABD5Z908_9EURY|nr:hypothetical protein [Halospeciosus flavus]